MEDKSEINNCGNIENNIIDKNSEVLKDEKKTSVSEAIKYRKRAQSAEKMLLDMQTKVETLTKDLQEAEDTVQYLEKRQKIDNLLNKHNVVDIETARLLTEVAISEVDDADLDITINNLVEQKPFLFRRRMGIEAAAMPEKMQTQNREVVAAAGEASKSGNRNDLLRYLKMKRKK